MTLAGDQTANRKNDFYWTPSMLKLEPEVAEERTGSKIIAKDI